MNVVAPARTSVAVVVLWEVRALPGEWIGIWLRKDITYHPSRDRLAARPALPRPGDRPGEHACRIGRTRGGSDGPVLEHPDRGLGWRPRSEEHTSELQSLAYLVCRLLLEKKKHTTVT